jgi:amyloid beta precursor protein binding protein 1
LHNIAACVGGAASQEALKVIVEQYVPLNNTFVFDGVFAKGAVYEL